MARRKGGFEGSVREDPKGSGSWQGRLPIRLDPHRRAVPGRYDSEIECRRALNETIADIDRGRKVKPIGKPGDPVRRLRDVVTEYIEDRRNDGMDPIALNTVRDYREVLKHVITHPYANLGKVPVNKIDGPTLDIWLRQMRDAGVAHRRATKAFAIVRATLAWEVRKGRLAVNPAREVRRTSTKKGRSQRQTADPVLLPSWGELADLASNPTAAGRPTPHPHHRVGRPALERSRQPRRLRRLAEPPAPERAPHLRLGRGLRHLGGRGGQRRTRRDHPPADAAVGGTPRTRRDTRGRGSTRRRPALQAHTLRPRHEAHHDHRPLRLVQARVVPSAQGRRTHRRPDPARTRPTPSSPPHQGPPRLRGQRRRRQRRNAVRGRGATCATRMCAPPTSTTPGPRTNAARTPPAPDFDSTSSSHSPSESTHCGSRGVAPTPSELSPYSCCPD